MPAKRQKLSHRANPLSEAFLAEDAAYVPPSSLRNEFGGKLRPQKRRLKERAPRKVPRPLIHNLRDPLHTLHDDVVHLVIALLPRRDTETLRRVSKLWKASSEYHCGKSALVRHFPWAAAKADGCETREAANLQFRRCLHYQENLEAGFATRAIRCDGASDWDIHRNRLTWSRGDEDIMIRDLRTPDDKSIVEPEIMSLSTSHILPEKTCRPYVRILPEGDFLMTTLLIRETLRGTHRLRRISAQGTVLWSVDLDGIMTRPAIGKDSVYFIHGPCHRTSRDRYKMLSFAKYNLYDGSKVFDVAMPPETQAKRKIQDLDRTLELTRNECWASWRRNSRYEVYFFSTSSGQLLKTSYEPRSVPPRLLESTSPSLQTAGFWITTSHTIELTTNDEVPGYLSDAKFYFYVDDKPHSSSSPIAFDGNHSVFLRTLHAPVGLGARDTDRANPFAQFAISPIEVVSAIELTSAEGAATVTLPGQSDGKRRDFELELPWELEEGDFFGMMDEYLIYQSPKNEFLVLVDFWPAW